MTFDGGESAHASRRSNCSFPFHSRGFSIRMSFVRCCCSLFEFVLGKSKVTNPAVVNIGCSVFPVVKNLHFGTYE